jgi:hexosaminidase
MDSVIREVSELFPFEYMHIGGDECAWNFWEKSDAVKRLMKEKGLGDMAAVQAYFVQRVSAIVTSRGKKTIGWDEIADDSASKGTTIMAWREMEAGLRSAKAGFPVILTPRSQYYLDYMQGDPVLEQPGPGVIRLRNVYNLDPFSSGIDPARLVGVQANLWTEHTLTQSRLEYQLWPRALAVAETGWYGKDSSGWVDFCRRVEARFRDMDLRNVRHAPSLYDPIVTVRRDDNDAITVALETEAPGLKIHYSFDFSHPDASYPVYSGPLRIPKDASVLKLVTSRDGKLIGRQLDLPVEALRQRAKFPFTLWQRVTSPTYLRRWIFLLAMLLMATLAWVVRLRRTSPPRRISE